MCISCRPLQNECNGGLDHLKARNAPPEGCSTNQLTQIIFNAVSTALSNFLCVWNLHKVKQVVLESTITGSYQHAGKQMQLIVLLILILSFLSPSGWNVLIFKIGPRCFGTRGAFCGIFICISSGSQNFDKQLWCCQLGTLLTRSQTKGRVHTVVSLNIEELITCAIYLSATEFDALTGCKLSSIDIGATVVRMAYSPAGGHVIVAVLEVRCYLLELSFLQSYGLSSCDPSQIWMGGQLERSCRG